MSLFSNKFFKKQPSLVNTEYIQYGCDLSHSFGIKVDDLLGYDIICGDNIPFTQLHEKLKLSAS